MITEFSTFRDFYEYKGTLGYEVIAPDSFVYEYFDSPFYDRRGAIDNLFAFIVKEIFYKGLRYHITTSSRQYYLSKTSQVTGLVAPVILLFSAYNTDSDTPLIDQIKEVWNKFYNNHELLKDIISLGYFKNFPEDEYKVYIFIKISELEKKFSIIDTYIKLLNRK